MKTRLIAITIGMACLLGAPTLASAQYTFGTPTQTDTTNAAPPPHDGR
jgi:hypothetical protein